MAELVHGQVVRGARILRVDWRHLGCRNLASEPCVAPRSFRLFAPRTYVLTDNEGMGLPAHSLDCSL